MSQPTDFGAWPCGGSPHRARLLAAALAIVLLGIGVVAFSLALPGVSADLLPHDPSVRAGPRAANAACPCSPREPDTAGGQAWRAAARRDHHSVARHVPLRSAAIALPGPSGEAVPDGIRAARKAKQLAADPRRYLAMMAHLAYSRSRAAPQSRADVEALHPSLPLPYQGTAQTPAPAP